MRTVAGTWIVAIAVSLWLFFTPYAQAVNVKSCHLLPPDSLHSKVIIPHLSKVNLFQLKMIFTEDRLGVLNNLITDCLGLSNLTEVEANHCAVIANSFDFVPWNNLGQKSLSSFEQALVVNRDCTNAQQISSSCLTPIGKNYAEIRERW